MSHATVLVLGDDIDGQLAPFCEQHEGDSKYSPYFEFEDKTEELRKDFNKLSTKKRKEYETETFEAYAEQQCGEPNAEGRYGYFSNPNAKWDWYEIGGRWNGFFSVKAEFRHLYRGANNDFLSRKYDTMAVVAKMLGQKVPEAPVLTDDVSTKADVILKGHVDIDAMRLEKQLAAEEEWDAFNAVRRGRDFTTWKETLAKYVKDDKPRTTGKKRSFDFDPDDTAPKTKLLPGGVEAARKAYHAQAVVKDLESDKSHRWVFNDHVELLAVYTRDQYIQYSRDLAMITFAVLKDGKWYERGEMGWWGIVSNEKDKDTWNQHFASLINDLPDDTKLTLVDFHI